MTRCVAALGRGLTCSWGGKKTAGKVFGSLTHPSAAALITELSVFLELCAVRGTGGFLHSSELQKCLFLDGRIMDLFLYFFPEFHLLCVCFFFPPQLEENSFEHLFINILTMKV